MTQRRNLRGWGYLAAALLGGLAIMFAPAILVGRPVVHGLVYPPRLLIWTVAVGLAMIWASVFAILNFRGKDEFEQQASRVGWYWGGTLGLAASAPIYVFVAAGGLHWLWPAIPIGAGRAPPGGAGYCLPVLMQFAGFLAVRAWWRLSKG
jgi:hypothetical protein